MKYKGYSAHVEYDPEERVFAGRVEHIRDVVTFEASDVESLEREFHLSVDEYLEFCRERGAEPEKPYSGNYLVRMGPELHKSVASAAGRNGMSLNAWMVAAIEHALSQPAQAAERKGVQRNRGRAA